MTAADHRLKTERFINKSGLRSCQPRHHGDTDVADRRLLRALVTRNNHAWLSLFPPILATQYYLRPRLHNFKNLPGKDNINFIPRVLYKR